MLSESQKGACIERDGFRQNKKFNGCELDGVAKLSIYDETSKDERCFCVMDVNKRVCGVVKMREGMKCGP